LISHPKGEIMIQDVNENNWNYQKGTDKMMQERGLFVFFTKYY
jgi:hypothetical protein